MLRGPFLLILRLLPETTIGRRGFASIFSGSYCRLCRARIHLPPVRRCYALLIATRLWQKVEIRYEIAAYVLPCAHGILIAVYGTHSIPSASGGKKIWRNCAYNKGQITFLFLFLFLFPQFRRAEFQLRRKEKFRWAFWRGLDFITQSYSCWLLLSRERGREREDLRSRWDCVGLAGRLKQVCPGPIRTSHLNTRSSAAIVIEDKRWMARARRSLKFLMDRQYGYSVGRITAQYCCCSRPSQQHFSPFRNAWLDFGTPPARYTLPRTAGSARGLDFAGWPRRTKSSVQEKEEEEELLCIWQTWRVDCPSLLLLLRWGSLRTGCSTRRANPSAPLPGGERDLIIQICVNRIFQFHPRAVAELAPAELGDLLTRRSATNKRRLGLSRPATN